MSQTFQKRVEDFACEQCGILIKGNGFTNHCPKCLWSKHVDNNPGDRASACKGMMKPISVEFQRQEYILTHKCEKCGHTKRNRVAPPDNYDVLATISKSKEVFVKFS